MSRALRILLLLCLLTPLAARSQTDLITPQGSQSANEIDLEISSIGLNKAARPGEWTGIRVTINDRGNSQRNILLRVPINDVDGDDGNYDVFVTTNPGIQQDVWAYARVPFDIASLNAIDVHAYEAIEADDPDQGTGFVPGRLLGRTTKAWGGKPTASRGIIGVVGRTPGGLSGYTQADGDAGATNQLGHEVSTISVMDTDDLPDRWLGYAMIRELVWTDQSPNDLRLEQVRALREWIERGGHLVIVLPAVSQQWLSLGNRELADILPRVEVTTLGGEPASSLRPLLTDSTYAELRIPELPVTIHTLTPLADAAPGEADPILNDSEGRTVVVSRTVGIGAVTVIGIPAWHPALINNGLPEADVFWHRVLGRRGQIATTAEFDQLRQSQQLVTSSRSPRVFDQDIADAIGKSGQSLIGVMLGLVVFIVYWLVAGPLGFAVLKQRKQSKHAWVAFLATTLAFTALAWGGATVIKPKRVEISHLTFLDQVYGQRVQRARSWASILVPDYGDATVRLESDDAASAGGSRFVQAVAPWEPPAASARGSFPDSRDYPIDSRDPESLTFPARATVKQVQLDWAGGIEWQSIRPILPQGVEDPFRAVRLAPPGTPSPLPEGSPPKLLGTLTHDLPAALDDVQIILFERQLPVRGNFFAKAQLFTVANSWALPGQWEPGQSIDLAVETGRGSTRGDSRIDDLLESMVTGRAFNRESNAADPGSRVDRFTWLSFFNLFAPPERPRGFEPVPIARRAATHPLDLSRWATRPCLVVIGTLDAQDDDSMPQPLTVAVNGREATDPRITGTTYVRWVYPLPTAPPDAPMPTPPPDLLNTPPTSQPDTEPADG